ncbi:MAG: nucleotide sugar dehydrogenase [Candidatus Omnitrophota bacterium]
MMGSYIKEFEERVNKRKIKIAVVGLGYVGLPLAVEFAKKGFSVTGIDLDAGRVQGVREKKSYITDISDKDLKQVVVSGKLRPESSFSLLKHCDAVFICVPTPLKRKYHPDISFIKAAVSQAAKNIKHQALVIVESTTYPGTTEEVILPMLEAGGRRQSRDFYLCFSPERVDPGNKEFSLRRIPKVIGGIDANASHLGRIVYSAVMDKVVVVSSTRIAEAVKLLENTFRIVNIGLIDEMAMMAHRMGMDIWEIINAASTKPFGFMPFFPGPGVGGHCIPKDPLYLYWKAKGYGFKSRFIKLASDTINHMPAYVVSRVRSLLEQNRKKFTKNKVLVLGVTYKQDIKDLRKSPALDIISILQKDKVHVTYHDPLIPYLKMGDIDLKSVKLTAANLKGFDCVIIATGHSSVNYRFILENSRSIFDTRNVYKGIKNKKIFKL